MLHGDVVLTPVFPPSPFSQTPRPKCCSSSATISWRSPSESCICHYWKKITDPQIFFLQLPPPIGQAPPTQGGGDMSKPAFPAYQNTEQQPASIPEGPVRQASKIPAVGAGCKLMHPEDDLSLVRSWVCSI